MENNEQAVLDGIKEIGGKVDQVKADIVADVDVKIKSFSDQLNELKNAQGEALTQSDFDKFKDDVEKAYLRNESKQTGEKSFNDHLSETLRKHASELSAHKKGSGDILMEMKAVGDMSIGANITPAAVATAMTQDVRTGLIQNPFDRTWLADILPQGTTKGGSILYPKENGGEGGAALWTDKATDKPQMDFDLTGQNAYLKWLAGIVVVDREMLDDIDWLESYLRAKMLISLKIAENNFILNGSADTNPVNGLLASATAYNGTYTAAADRVIDAGWGQIVEDTFDFYNPTHAILTPRDAVKIGLNKATGSGEYNLPDGSVAFVNGKLTVGGISTVNTTQVGAGNFLVFDRNATMFVRRMQPELRMFEDWALAKRNKVGFRIEERATLAVFNNKAIVKGTLAGA